MKSQVIKKVDEINIEACVENFSEALMAQERGAHQVELCSRLDVDGLTPSIDDITRCLNDLHIHTKVMIRPKAGNFVLTRDCKRIMFREINMMKKIGVQEVVLGASLSDGSLDIPSIVQFVERASPMAVTIHKAIDQCPDIMHSLESLMATGGIKSILTSGGKPTAEEGTETLKNMINLADGRINIIAAGKITNLNIEELHQRIQGTHYHGRRIVGSLS